ncbi:MAG: hypothetical protein PW734_04690 [Verrucomicrobium sp.]|nr:hypothetical protein [Verrucomicrobium sp.]
MDAINSTNAAVSLQGVKTASSTSAASSAATTSQTTTSETASVSLPSDKVSISSDGERAARFIQEARSTFSQSNSAGFTADQIQQWRAAIAKGEYPPQALTAGLLSLIGTSLVAQQDS